MTTSIFLYVNDPCSIFVLFLDDAVMFIICFWEAEQSMLRIILIVLGQCFLSVVKYGPLEYFSIYFVSKCISLAVSTFWMVKLRIYCSLLSLLGSSHAKLILLVLIYSIVIVLWFRILKSPMYVLYYLRIFLKYWTEKKVYRCFKIMVGKKEKIPWAW